MENKKIVSSKKNNDIILKKKDSEIDMTSGSMAYNRFEMQISQTLHMAIEFYDDLDYLFILDYYDDITLFESENYPKIVSYYQMKTKEESISINTAIREDWLLKMYAHLDQPQWIIKELGLITNCPLSISFSTTDKEGKKIKYSKLYKSERTSFSQFDQNIIDKIKKDIAKKKKIDEKDVDLSRFVHKKTTLSISKHKEIVEQEMNDFLYEKYPKITVDSVKTIFNAMLQLLTKKQQYELFSDQADYEEVRAKKGISKNDFSKIIDNAIIISIPQFEEIQRVAQLKDEDKYQASYEYTKIMSDSQGKLESFKNLFFKVCSLVKQNDIESEQTSWDYAEILCNELYNENSKIRIIYNKYYVKVLVICILINEMRKL